jgi:hypothetical protein
MRRKKKVGGNKDEDKTLMFLEFITCFEGAVYYCAAALRTP